MREATATHDPAAAEATLPRCLWIFALLGPPFGYVTIAVLSALGKSDTVVEFLWVPLAVVMTAPFALPIAWFIGVVPAMLVGVVYWALRAKAGVGSMAGGALAAIAAGIVCAGVVAISEGSFGGLLDSVYWQMMIVPGIVATPLCAAYIERGLKLDKRKHL